MLKPARKHTDFLHQSVTGLSAREHTSYRKICCLGTTKFALLNILTFTLCMTDSPCCVWWILTWCCCHCNTHQCMERALERQDLPCTYLDHHQPESLTIFIVVYVESCCTTQSQFGPRALSWGLGLWVHQSTCQALLACLAANQHAGTVWDSVAMLKCLLVSRASCIGCLPKLVTCCAESTLFTTLALHQTGVMASDWALGHQTIFKGFKFQT